MDNANGTGRLTVPPSQSQMSASMPLHPTDPVGTPTAVTLSLILLCDLAVVAWEMSNVAPIFRLTS